MSLTIGSLCSGYGGIDLAVEAVLDARTAWVSDIDKGACKVLAHRFPDAPNLGDMTALDWSQVEPVDIITGGTPCQDLSHAGKRAGMTEGTRSNLWVAMREAIATIRPRLVIWENVGGAYSAEADSELVNNPRLLADTRRRDGEPVLRALGRVLGDLASLGYMGGWHGLRAADVGAPHGRLRVFVIAADAQRGGLDGWASDALRGSLGRAASAGSGQGDGTTAHTDGRVNLASSARADLGAVPGRDAGSSGEDLVLLGTPRCADGVTHDLRAADAINNPRGRLEDQVALLPTPRATDGTKGGPNQRGSSGDLMLPSAVAHLFPTPTTMDSHSSGGGYNGQENVTLTDATARQGAPRVPEWGQYAAAIARWESLTRPAPEPTETGAKGNPRLSPRFTEWMMGLPAGWITDVPDVTRNEALKLCGNGVVAQQAEAALRFLLPIVAGLEVAA